MPSRALPDCPWISVVTLPRNGGVTTGAGAGGSDVVGAGSSGVPALLSDVPVLPSDAPVSDVSVFPPLVAAGVAPDAARAGVMALPARVIAIAETTTMAGRRSLEANTSWIRSAIPKPPRQGRTSWRGRSSPDRGRT